MVTKSLNDIPYEIYFENFIPVLEIKEIGILSMVSPTLNSILSNNEFWKQIYFKTTKKKIVETIVHIGPYSLRQIKNKRNGLITPLKLYNNLNKTKYINTAPEGYEFVKTDIFLGLLDRTSDIFYDSIHCMPCCINKFKYPDIKSIKHVCSNGITNHYYLNEQSYEVRQKYVEYLKDKGVFTCSCTNHYDETTLEYDGIKIDFKDFKNRTIKKLITVNKRKLKPIEAKFGRKKLQVQKLRDKLKKIEEEENKLLEDVDKYKGLDIKFKDALK